MDRTTVRTLRRRRSRRAWEQPASGRLRNERRFELVLFGLVLAAGNAHLIAGALPDWSLIPDRVAAGEWWRLLTHPFVHLSAWHLLLDAGAFVLVWTGIEGMGRAARYVTAGACLAGSALAALLFDPRVATLGLCGLSGTAHGLTAVYGLSLAKERGAKSFLGLSGLLCFAGVAIKSIVEARTGAVVLASWHLGSVGTPIAVVHLGGVVGGTLAFAAWAATRRFLNGLAFDLAARPVRPHPAPGLRRAA